MIARLYPEMIVMTAIRTFLREPRKYVDDCDGNIDGSESDCISYSFHHLDTDQDWAIGDFELLGAIDKWAAGKLGDFELLDLIDYWAVGSYCWDTLTKKYKAGIPDVSGTCQ